MLHRDYTPNINVKTTAGWIQYCILSYAILIRSFQTVLQSLKLIASHALQIYLF